MSNHYLAVKVIKMPLQNH